MMLATIQSYFSPKADRERTAAVETVMKSVADSHDAVIAAKNNLERTIDRMLTANAKATGRERRAKRE